MRVGSLCTGYGGLDMAVGGDLVWVSDIDKGACALLAHRHPDIPNLGDLKKIDWSAVEPVDVLTAGYPCQPFSVAGKQKGAEDERHIWPWIIEGIRILRPTRVVLENVAGHLRLGFGDVLGSLAEAGYDAEWVSVRASDVGAAHNRNRVFVVATDAGSERHGGWEIAGAVGRIAGPLAGETRERERARQIPESRTLADFGQYRPAIQRWEHATGRGAPNPTTTGRTGSAVLNPAFVEWMMGLPAGWVTDVPGLSRTAQLKLLGNGVVPQQAEYALSQIGL